MDLAHGTNVAIAFSNTTVGFYETVSALARAYSRPSFSLFCNERQLKGTTEKKLVSLFKNKFIVLYDSVV